jgi:hypothetical protein
MLQLLIDPPVLVIAPVVPALKIGKVKVDCE